MREKITRSKSLVRFRKVIPVKGVSYKIVIKADLRDDDGKECMGLHDHENKIIFIDKKLTPSEKRQTFLHEFFHAYLYECHIREGIDATLEEVIVEVLSQAIESEFNISWKRR